jgi:uncharacterized SAM-binding protein YcdF (DUF218 family)
VGSLVRARRQWWRTGLAVVALAVVALAWRSTWLPAVGTALAAREDPRPADVIVMTYGAMMSPDGVAEAERLYRAGWAGTIALSDFKIDQRGWAFDRLQPITRRRLTLRGVPEAAIVEVPGTPDNELEEALALRSIFAERGWRRALLVARDYRLLRTTGTLRQAMAADGVELIPRPVQESSVDLARWWTTADGVSAVANEWPRVLYYRLLGRM